MAIQSGFGRTKITSGTSYPSPRSTGSVTAVRRRARGGRPGTRSSPVRTTLVDPARNIAPSDHGAPGVIGGISDSIAADYDALIANARGSGGGGGGPDYSADIAQAQELLDDIVANRAAIQGVYTEAGEFLDPLSQEAIDAASAIVAENQGVFDAIAETEQTGIAGSFDEAEGAIAEMAALIGAGDVAAETVQEEAIQTEALALEQAIQEADTATNILGLTQGAERTQAVSGRSSDQGSREREAELVDIEFKGMEEDVRDQLAQLRRAQAQARAAAAARRAAAARDVAALEDERFKAMQLTPFEAGEATMVSYLGRQAQDLPPNRQQLVLSTASNAISSQVPSTRLLDWMYDQGVASSLSRQEKDLVRGGVQAYTAGMNHQWNRDRR